MDTNFNNDPHIPTRLEGDLRSAFGGFGAVPAEVDRAVMGMVEGVAAGAAVRRRRVAGRRVVLMGGVAAAAAVVVMVWVVVGPGGTRKADGPAGTLAAGVQGDLNGDGKVDMLDALIEAERVKGGGGADVNGDGKVDGADVDAIAISAVKLERGSL
jgi:hypothetical protein